MEQIGKDLRLLGLLLGSFMIIGCASGILLTKLPGVLACLVTPTYSEWSVTPMKSIGVSIRMSNPIGCLMDCPWAYCRASPGPVIRLPKIQASTDQLVWMCVSPK